jgi:hypothetical protein
MANEIVSRAYNTFNVDALHGTITKSSQTDRLVGEINFYQNIPDQFKVLFPRLLESGTDWIKLEYLDYPNFGSYLISENEEITLMANTEFELYWPLTIKQLHSLVSEFKTYTDDSQTSEFYSRAMYIDKTKREYENLKQYLPAEMFDAKTLIINGEKCHNFEQIWPAVRYYIEKYLIKYTASFMHGDCCLSNILYSHRSAVMRFIDPRGEYGIKGIWGDAKYDVAKLYHSFDGGYEFIINDKFSAVTDGGFTNWDISTGASHSKYCADAKQAFEDVFFKEYNKTDIQILEGCIYIGMAARHYDSVSRQKMMYLTGIQILNDALLNV